MQQVDIEGVSGEKMTGIERFHQYGFVSNVQPEQQQTEQQGSGAGGLGSGSGATTGKGKSAECVVLCVNGNRSHPIVIMVDDRRYRLQGLKSGEVALFDDQQQQVHITRDGVFASVPHDKTINWRIMPPDDGGSSRDGSGGAQQQQDGQKPQATKKAYASHTLDKDGFTVNHPGKIVHNIIDDQGNVKYSMTLDNSGGFTGNFKDVQWNQTP